MSSQLWAARLYFQTYCTVMWRTSRKSVPAAVCTKLIQMSATYSESQVCHKVWTSCFLVTQYSHKSLILKGTMEWFALPFPSWVEVYHLLDDSLVGNSHYCWLFFLHVQVKMWFVMFVVLPEYFSLVWNNLHAVWLLPSSSLQLQDCLDTASHQHFQISVPPACNKLGIVTLSQG